MAFAFLWIHRQGFTPAGTKKVEAPHCDVSTIIREWQIRKNGCQTPCLCQHIKLILDRANKAHTLTVVPFVFDVRFEVRLFEVHAFRAVLIFVRGRPVVAFAAHIVETSVGISEFAFARSRQEDRTCLLQSTPLCRRDSIAAVAGTTAVGVAQTVGVAAPVVGQQDYSIHIVHLGLGITDACGRCAGIEDIYPFGTGQRSPLVFLAAAVAYRVVTPIGIAGFVEQVFIGPTVGIIFSIIIITTPRLVAGGTVVVAARSPAEEVVIGGRNAGALSITKIIPLVVGKLPVRRGGTANVLQVALREIHLCLARNTLGRYCCLW